MWSSFSPPERLSGRRYLLGPSIVVVPFSSPRALRTEILAWSLDCGRPFRLPVAPPDGETCSRPRLWSFLSPPERRCGRRYSLGPSIVVVPFSSQRALRTEKLAQDLICGLPFRLLVAPPDGDTCSRPRLWSSLPTPEGFSGRRIAPFH